MTDRTHPDSGRIVTSGDVINNLHNRIDRREVVIKLLKQDVAAAHAQLANALGTRKVLWNLLGECLPVIDALMQVPGDDDSDARLNCLAGRINDARTAQSADSVPAVSDLPPLPAPDLRDVGTKPQEIKEFLKGYATEYARTAIAARAPADSVQEDAARLDFLIEQRAYVVSDPDACPGYWLHWARPDGRTWVQGDEHPTPRAAIDAGRKQGARWQSAVRALTLHI